MIGYVALPRLADRPCSDSLSDHLGLLNTLYILVALMWHPVSRPPPRARSPSSQVGAGHRAEH